MTSRGDCCVLEQASVSRRDMLCGGGAVLFGVLIEFFCTERDRRVRPL